MKKQLLILVLLLVHLFPGTLRAQEKMHQVRHYSAADGLSQNTVMSILQDRDGFMWIGTWDGLNRFDGYNFKVYKPSQAGPNTGSNRVDHLFEDSLGYIWLHTNDGGFYRLNKHTDQLVQTPVKSTRFGNEITSKANYLEQKKGLIWLTGENLLLRICEHENDLLNDALDTRAFTLGSEAECLLADPQGNLWVGAMEGLECIAPDDEQTVYSPGHSNEDNHFTTGVVLGQNIWFGTESGILWRYSMQKRQFTRIALPLHSTITSLTLINNRTLLATSKKDGFVCFDTQDGSCTAYHADNNRIIRSNCFTNSYRASDGRVWLINEEPGALCYQPVSGELKRYTSQPDRRFEGLQFNHFFAFEDAQGHTWLNPYMGGFCTYDSQKDQLVSPEGVSNVVHSAYADRDGRIWIGSYSLGLDYITIRPKLFDVSDNRHQSPLSCEVRSLLQLRNGDILEACKDKTLRRYNAEHQLQDTRPTGHLIYCMTEAADGSLLMGTKGEGLFITRNGQTQHYRHHEGQATSLLCDKIYDMVYGSDGALYLATYDGGVNILRGGQFIHCENGWSNYPNDFGSKVRCLLWLNDTTLLAGTTNGLLSIQTTTLETHQFPYCDILCMQLDHEGHLWFGSFGGCLVEVLNPQQNDLLAKENCRTYTTSDGLPSDIILSAVTDREGELWFTTENGICRYQQDSQNFLSFSPLIAAEGAIFSEAKGICTHTGEVIFGHTGGDCYFHPDQIYRSDAFPPLHFTECLVGGEPATIGRRAMLSNCITFEPTLRLKHNQPIFTLGYAAQEYDAPMDIRYAYKLEGVDKEWNNVRSERRVTYSNLRAGNYTFRLRCTNADGIWSDKEEVLHISVAPSPWLSWWAIILYLLLAACLCYYIFRTLAAGNRMRQELAVEQKVTDFKLRFFTNISHELRTPLTLITGPVESLLRTENLSPMAKTQLQIVASNASRMLRLINQILDFRKIQNQKMRLRVQHFNLATLAEETARNFRKEATDKRIAFRVENTADNPDIWADREKIDTIIYNLLSNAFKFTPAGQSVTLRVSEKPNFLLLQVQDTGVGIPKEKRALLFQRFSSNNEINATAGKTGTGIGLNLVKELVSLHSGYIEVDSEPGVGSTFTIMLRRGKDHFSTGTDLIVGDNDTNQAPVLTIEEEEPQIQPKPNSILVVDDNSDMRTFLSEILQPHFCVLTAENGQEAIRLARQKNPDIVVSDLMMPEMDGLELTNTLKTEISTSHLPIILLTAKSAIESRLEALHFGADDYITKPFSPEYLLARIDNLLQQRERIREAYRASLSLPKEAEKPTPKTPDELFLNKLYNFMMQNMDNNNLAVEDLVREMALGRTVFFNKLKSLTGLSPVEYIRDVRIKKAAELLLDGRYNITEVTYMVGMNDSRYFAKCFKTEYGITPTEYRRQHQTEENV